MGGHGDGFFGASRFADAIAVVAGDAAVGGEGGEVAAGVAGMILDVADVPDVDGDTRVGGAEHHQAVAAVLGDVEEDVGTAVEGVGLLDHDVEADGVVAADEERVEVVDVVSGVEEWGVEELAGAALDKCEGGLELVAHGAGGGRFAPVEEALSDAAGEVGGV